MAQQYGLRQPVRPIAEPEPELNEFQKGFRRFIGGVSPAIDRTQATVQQALGFDEAAQANLEEARAAEAAAQTPELAPRVGRIEDVRTDSLGGFAEDVGSYSASVLGENLPLLGGMAAGGIGGAVAGRALGAPKLGAFTGAAAPYEAVSVAESSRDIMDNPNATGTPQEQAMGALATGTAKTALGMAPIGIGARMLRGPGGRLAKGTRVGAASAATEGVTEAGEELIGRYGQSQYVPGTELFDEEARSRYLNAAVGGAILGGPTGFAAGVLAPKRLSRAAEHAMQTAAEEGRSPIEGANDFINQNADLFSDEELAALGPEIEGFQAGPPRSRMERAMADLEAREELELAYSQIPDSAYHRRKAKQTQAQIDNTAYDLITGKITREQALDLWPQDVLEESVVRQSEQLLPPSSEGVGQQLDPGEQMQLDEQETKVQFLSSKKGLPWHISEKENVEAVAKNTLMDTLSTAQRQDYEKSTGKRREQWDKAIKESRPRPVTLRTKLLREARDEGVSDVDTYMLAKIEQEYLPAFREAEPGTAQHNKYLEYRKKPEAMLDEFGFLAKEDVPAILNKYGVDTVKAEEIGTQRSGDLRNEQAIRALDADIKELEAGYDAAVYGDQETKEAFETYRDRKGGMKATPEQLETFAAVAERQADPNLRELFETIDAKKKDRHIRRFKRQGIIESRDNKSQGKIGASRIPVEVYDYDPKQKRMRWIKRQMNPMAAAIKAQREVPFDPEATGDAMMRQILEGIGAVLGSQKFEARKGAEGTLEGYGIRLPIEIHPETIVYRRAKTSGLSEEQRTIKWGDVLEWEKSKDEKKSSEWLPDDVPGIQGEEGIENAKPETKPLKPYDPRDPKTSHTTAGGLAKDPGPYVFDLKKPKEPLSAKELPTKVISGGQTGADLGGLVGAEHAGIATGGTAPKGWRTQKGAQPTLGTRFGLVESDSSGYQKRTEQNVIEADLTFIFRPEGHSSPGTNLTIKLAKKHGKPFRIIDPWDERAKLQITQSIRKHQPATINIAGPREESVKGMAQQTAYVLSNAFEAPGEVVTRTRPATEASKAKAAEDKRSLRGIANKISKKKKFTEPVESISKDPKKAFWQGIKEGTARKLANQDIAQRSKPFKKLEFSEELGVPKSEQAKVDKLINAHDTKRQNRHQRLATKMAKQLGVTNIRVLDTKEAVALMVAAGDGSRITRKNGFSTRKGGEALIYVNPVLPEDAAIEILGHEIGHVVLDDTWQAAPKRLRNAVEKEFAAYLEAVGADPTIYDVISKRTPQRILERTIFGYDTDQKISELPQAQQKYLLEFKEWFADNVAKWMVTDAKPRSLVQQFFKHVADLITDLWNSLVKQVNTPEKSVQEYMDRLFMVEPEPTFGPEHAFAFSEVPKGVNKDTASAASSAHGATWFNSDEGVIRQAMRELLNEPEINVLGNLVHKTHIRRQLSKVYGTDPAAMGIIDESRTDEMIVLLFKAWRAGEVNLSRRHESIFTQFMERLAEILGIIMQSQQAERLMTAISDGAIKQEEADRVHYLQARVNETNIQQARQVIEKLSTPALRWAGKIGGTAEMRVRWAKNSALTELWKQIYLSPDTTGGREGFFAATRRTRAFFERKMHSIFDGKDQALGEEVVRILNKQDKLDPNTEAGKLAQEVYDLLQEIRKFSIDAGVKMGFLGKDYFPRVYDMDVLVKNRDEFIDMLVERYPIDLQEYYSGLYQKDPKAPPPTKTNREIAEFIHRNLTTHQGDELSAIEEIQREMEGDPLGWPVLDAAKTRSLAWIENEDAAPYLSHDLGLTLSTYIYQASKRAEYNRRFGVGTGKRMVTSYLNEARDKGASDDDMKMAHNAVKAALGTLGADINPTFHKWQGIIMVLENWMLLGLATLTSLVDPVGIAVRGDLETAWSSLKQGLSEVKAKMKGEQTDLSEMAGMLGINELHNTVEALGYEYGGYYVTGAARRWNERLFSVNMLTQWTRMTRTMALAGARRFIGKHAAMDNAKSERFMAELGLRKGDVVLDENGNATILDDAEVENLQMASKKSWDDKSLEKHFVREYDARGNLINLDKDIVHSRFKNVDWDTAPKNVVEDLLKKKESTIKWFEKESGQSGSMLFKDDGPKIPIDEIRAEASILRASLRRGDKYRGKTRDAADAQAEFERDERVRQALNRWVDEAILRPDAAQRPIWASDPHWMLVFHLKAFIYSFHERILRRVGHEIMEGNYQPAVMLMGYLPMMFISEAIRNTIQGDDMDEYTGKDAGFWATSHHMAQRAGLYGIGQFYFDAKQGWQYGDTPFSTLGGPAVEHVLSLGEAALTASTADDARVAVRSLPFHNVWKDYFK